MRRQPKIHARLSLEGLNKKRKERCATYIDLLGIDGVLGLVYDSRLSLRGETNDCFKAIAQGRGEPGNASRDRLKIVVVISISL